MVAGDLDQDGVRDVFVGVPGAPWRPKREGAAPGRVWVVSGKSGKVVRRWGGSSGRTGLGTVLFAAEDGNGDGVPDLIVGYGDDGAGELRCGRTGVLIKAVSRTRIMGHSVPAAAGVLPGGELTGDGRDVEVVVTQVDGVTALATKPGARSRDKPMALPELNPPLRTLATAPLAGTDLGDTPAEDLVVAGVMDRGIVSVQALSLKRLLWSVRIDPKRKPSALTLRELGDANGDRVRDVLLGFGTGSNGRRSGALTLLSGVDGAQLWRLDEEAGFERPPRFAWGREPGLLQKDEGNRFGRSVLSIGDRDGDGWQEFLVGAPAATFDKDNPRLGAVLMLSGRDRSVLACWRGDPDASGFGEQLRLTSDFDGDGIQEVEVAYSYPEEYDIRSGRDGRLHRKRGAGVLPAPGESLADLDGDGHLDHIGVGSPEPFTVTLVARSGAGGELWTVELYDGGATSSASLAATTDHDADGVPDILVGTTDWFDHGRISPTGMVRLLSGKTGAELWKLHEKDLQ